MALYLVTYDLNSPGQNYQPLWGALDRLGAKRALESVWILRSNRTAAALVDSLKIQIDANDRLLVATIGNDWATLRAIIDINTI